MPACLNGSSLSNDEARNVLPLQQWNADAAQPRSHAPGRALRRKRQRSSDCLKQTFAWPRCGTGECQRAMATRLHAPKGTVKDEPRHVSSSSCCAQGNATRSTASSMYLGRRKGQNGSQRVFEAQRLFTGCSTGEYRRTVAPWLRACQLHR